MHGSCLSCAGLSRKIKELWNFNKEAEQRVFEYFVTKGHFLRKQWFAKSKELWGVSWHVLSLLKYSWSSHRPFHWAQQEPSVGGWAAWLLLTSQCYNSVMSHTQAVLTSRQLGILGQAALLGRLVGHSRVSGGLWDWDRYITMARSLPQLSGLKRSWKPNRLIWAWACWILIGSLAAPRLIIRNLAISSVALNGTEKAF